MRIKYNIVEDDAVAANIVIARHSPYIRRQRVILGLIVPGLFLVIVLLNALYSKDWGAAVIGVVVVVGLAVWMLAGKNRRMERVTRKLFREGKNKGFLGVHELEISDYGILSKSEYGEGKIAWAVIERIVSTPDYTFIFTGASKAVPLPKNRILEGDYDAFVVELTSCFAKFAAMAPISPDNVKETVFVDLKPVACEDKRAGMHSGYGITSFVISLTSMGLIFLAFIVAVVIGIVSEYSPARDNPFFMAAVIGFVLAWGAAFVGTGFGIAGLLTKNRKKTYAIVGLIINLLIVFSVVLIIKARSCS
jgi:hypothetical protein